MTISICIITLGRTTIYHTLEGIFSQKIDSIYEVIIVLQGTVDTEKIDALNKNSIDYKIFTYERGLGFGFYRNRAIEYATGDILVWIDDDERTMDDYWLNNLTMPIRQGHYEVTTSGYCIPLGQGYLTDSISLLGWPGGGALGFDKMWPVNRYGVTNHLCSGNFAINKKLISVLRFSEVAHWGGEDNILANSLISHNVQIFYEKKATVYHVSRTFSEAFSWWKIRILSNKNLIKNGLLEESLNKKRLRFLKNILRIDKYLPGRLFCVICILGISFRVKFSRRDIS